MENIVKKMTVSNDCERQPPRWYVQPVSCMGYLKKPWGPPFPVEIHVRLHAVPNLGPRQEQLSPHLMLSVDSETLSEMTYNKTNFTIG